MRRFMLFVFDDYYPRGGVDDFKGSFDTIELAEQKLNNKHEAQDYTNAHIFDLETRENVKYRGDEDFNEEDETWINKWVKQQ